MKNSTIKVFCAIYLFFIAQAAQAQTRFPPEKINAIETMITAQMEKTQTPGLAYVLIEDGHIVHGKGFGIASRDGMPVTIKTAFNIGSLTKSFTAMAIMDSKEQNKLGLDMPIITYLPGFRTKDKALSDKITVRHLLSHTSGLTMYTGNLNQTDKSNNAGALTEAIKDLRSAKLHTLPGEQFQYSNANYQILGALLEQVWGMPYEDIIKHRIIGPLSLNDSFVRLPVSKHTHIADPHRIWLNQARYYNWEVGRKTIAQGGVYASAQDMATYMWQYLREEPFFLTKENINEMIALPGETDRGYGFGWSIEKNYNGALGQTYVYHSGLSPGYSSLAGFSPESKTGYVILTNASTGFVGGNVSAMKFSLGNFIMGKPESRSLAMPRLNLFLLLMVVFVPVGIAIWAFVFLAKYKNPPRRNKLHIQRMLIPSALLGGLAWGLGVVAPKSFGAPLGAARLFNPDIGWALTISVLACLIWAALRLVLMITENKQSTVSALPL